MTDAALPERLPTHAERQAAIDRIQTAMLDDHLTSNGTAAKSVPIGVA